MIKSGQEIMTIYFPEGLEDTAYSFLNPIHCTDIKKNVITLRLRSLHFLRRSNRFSQCSVVAEETVKSLKVGEGLRCRNR